MEKTQHWTKRKAEYASLDFAKRVRQGLKPEDFIPDVPVEEPELQDSLGDPMLAFVDPDTLSEDELRQWVQRLVIERELSKPSISTYLKLPKAAMTNFIQGKVPPSAQTRAAWVKGARVFVSQMKNGSINLYAVVKRVGNNEPEEKTKTKPNKPKIAPHPAPKPTKDSETNPPEESQENNGLFQIWLERVAAAEAEKAPEVERPRVVKPPNFYNYVKSMRHVVLEEEGEYRNSKEIYKILAERWKTFSKEEKAKYA